MLSMNIIKYISNPTELSNSEHLYVVLTFLVSLREHPVPLTSEWPLEISSWESRGPDCSVPEAAQENRCQACNNISSFCSCNHFFIILYKTCFSIVLTVPIKKYYIFIIENAENTEKKHTRKYFCNLTSLR